MRMTERNRFRPTLEGLESRNVPTFLPAFNLPTGPALNNMVNSMIPSVTIALPDITIIPVAQINIAVLSNGITQINFGNINL